MLRHFMISTIFLKNRLEPGFSSQLLASLRQVISALGHIDVGGEID
jgi:hypothetical protein